MIEFPKDDLARVRMRRRAYDRAREVAIETGCLDRIIAYLEHFETVEVETGQAITGDQAELKIDDPRFERVDLIRVNGRVFVPEVVEAYDEDNRTRLQTAWDGVDSLPPIEFSEDEVVMLIEALASTRPAEPSK